MHNVPVHHCFDHLWTSHTNYRLFRWIQ